MPGNPTVAQIVAAIRQHESGGNYQAQNPYATASGAYQFINSTWQAVLARFRPDLAGRYPTAKSAPPAVQDEVALKYAQSIADANGGDLRSIPATWYVGHFDPNNLNYIPSPDAGNTKTVAAFINDIYELAGSAPPISGSPSPSGNPTAGDVGSAVDSRLATWAWIREEDPTLASLFDRAAAGEISYFEFEAGLMASDWWRTHSDTQRQFDTRFNTDQASLAQDIEQLIGDIGRFASQMGVTLSTSQTQFLAFHALRNGMRVEDWQRAVIAAGRFIESGAQPGLIGDVQTQIRELGAQYAIDVDDRRAFEWSQQIAGGALTMEGLEQRFRQQAKGLFPAFAEQIDQGVTVQDLASPYINAAANLLELDPSHINLTEWQWHRALSQRGENGKAAPMDLGEWSQTLMNDPRYEWGKTDNARDAAYGMIQQLGQTMGVY